jgi:hypothetical protein
VDEVVLVVPERCRHCGQPLPEVIGRRRGRVWRHQMMELLPLAVRVTEYQMIRRCCPTGGKRTRADLPVGVPRRPFGVRLTAERALRPAVLWRKGSFGADSGAGSRFAARLLTVAATCR